MRRPYTGRSDGRIAVTLDSNVWDFLFARNLILSTELSCDAFALFITREMEIEGSAMWLIPLSQGDLNMVICRG